MVSTFGVQTLIGDTSSRYLALEAISDVVEYLTQEIRMEGNRAYFIRAKEGLDKDFTGSAQLRQHYINSILISGVVDGTSNEEFAPLKKKFEKLVQQISLGLEQRLKLEGLSDTHEIDVFRDGDDGNEDVTISFWLKNYAEL